MSKPISRLAFLRISGNSVVMEQADKVTEAGGKAEIVVTELTEEESIKNLVKTTSEKFGRLDILVNNAGITHSAGLEQTTTQDWERRM